MRQTINKQFIFHFLLMGGFAFIAMLSAFGRLTGYIHWVLLILFTIVAVTVFMLRDFSNGGHGDHAGSEDGPTDHGHTDTAHAAH